MPLNSGKTATWIGLVGLAFLVSACASTFQDPGPIRTHARGAYPQFDHSAEPQQCVPYARKKSGISIYGDATSWWAQGERHFDTSDTPRTGAVIVLRGYKTDKRAHVAVVRKILDDRQITVDHSNWANRGEVQLDIPVFDVSDANDWSRVRVWNLDGRHFGGRVYDVEGFILPERRSTAGLLW